MISAALAVLESEEQRTNYPRFMRIIYQTFITLPFNSSITNMTPRTQYRKHFWLSQKIPDHSLMLP